MPHKTGGFLVNGLASVAFSHGLDRGVVKNGTESGKLSAPPASICEILLGEE
jgi:hypothetical protein